MKTSGRSPVGVLVLLVTVVLARLSLWSQHEADYWSDVAFRVRLMPKLEPQYRPILDWAQTHRPSRWEQIRGWRSPSRRMDEASA